MDQTYGAGYNNGGHLDAGEVIQIIQRMKAARIMKEGAQVYATHISHEGNGVHERIEKLACENGYHIGYDGLEIHL